MSIDWFFFFLIGCYSRKGANEIKAQIQSTTPNQQNKNIKIKDYQPSENLFKKYLDKVNTDPYEGPVLTHEASNKLLESYKKADAIRLNYKMWKLNDLSINMEHNFADLEIKTNVTELLLNK